jgi:hypothetical protein
MMFSRTVLGLALVAATGGIAVAAIPDEDGVISACVAADGTVRVIDPDSSDPKRRSCKSTETALSWNQKGQPGPTGAPGPQGPAAASQCDDDQLVLCLPADPGLEPRLNVAGRIIVGESYRLHVKVPINHTFSSDGLGQPIQLRTVGNPQFGFVLVADLAQEGLAAAQWNHDVMQHGLDSNMRDATLTLHDGDTVVARVQLTRAVLHDYRFVGGRVQMMFDVEDVAAEPVG